MGALNYLRIAKYAQRVRNKLLKNRTHRSRSKSLPHTMFRILKFVKKECRNIRKKHGKRVLAFHAKFRKRKSRMTQSNFQKLLLSDENMAVLRAELTEDTTDPNADRAESAEDRRPRPRRSRLSVMAEVHRILGLTLDGVADYLSS